MLSSETKRKVLAAAVLNLTAAGAHGSSPILTPALAMASHALGVHATNCNDSGPGSLRDLLFSASNNEFIELPLTCSKITLTSGALTEGHALSSVNIVGYGTVIDGDYRDRVIVHAGTGTLWLSGVTITKGLYDGPFGGGCIYSAGSVGLRNSTVTNCVLSTIGDANGGGIFARADIDVKNSTISNNHALSSNGSARGGGAFARNIDITSYPYAKGATISDNVANGIDSSGGGLFASNTYGPGRITLSASTVSRNQASKSSARGDPKLGPLKFNGGHTMTHALLPGSPAINRGEGSPAEYDQRGKPYSRVDGAAADIGAFETSDRFFFDGFDP